MGQHICIGPLPKDIMSNPIEIVKSFYAALGRGDVSSLLATLHDDLEWTEAERFPYYSGTWHSPQEVCDRLSCPFHVIGNDSRPRRTISSRTVSALFRSEHTPERSNPRENR